MSTLIFAHRGYHSLHPENTIEAFDKALELGADGIELDIHFSKDGQLMVYHDFELDHKTGKSGLICEHTLSELRNINILSQNSISKAQYKIPVLDEVLELILDYKKRTGKKFILNVELKAGSQFYDGIEKAVYDSCFKQLEIDDIIFSSFDHNSLVELKKINPAVKTGILTASSLYKPWDYIRTVNADYYHPHYITLTSESLKALSLNNISINTYTVNDVKTAKNLIISGVNAIITDELEEILKIREVNL